MAAKPQASAASLLSDPWGNWEEEADNNWLISFVDILSLTLALLVLIVGNLLIERSKTTPVVGLPVAVTAPVTTPPPAMAELRPEAAPLHVPVALPEVGTRLLPPVEPVEPIVAATTSEPSPAALVAVGVTPVIAPTVASPVLPLGEPTASPAPLLATPDQPLPADQAVPFPPPAAEPAPEERLVNRVRERLAGMVRAERSERGVSLEIGESVLFGSGRAELLGGAQPVIDKIADSLREAGPVTVAVEGHTDDRPIHGGRFATNWELSTARATAVTRRLIELGLPAAQLRSVGYADTRPVADNRSREGRAQNRRVNLLVEFAAPAKAVR